MPIPEDIVRVNLKFILDGGTEEVSNTLHLLRQRSESGQATNWPANTQEIANKVRDKFLASTIRNTLANQAFFQKVTAYHLSAEGKTLHKAEAFTASGLTGVTGLGGTPPLPYDVACVVSLRTDQPGDFFPDPDTGPSPAKRSRGRIFQGPVPASFIVAGGRFGADKTTLIRDAWVNFLNDLSDMTVGGSVTPDTMVPVILSKAGGTARKITEVVVDDLPDTQRRRSNRLLPNRSRAFTDQRSA